MEGLLSLLLFAVLFFVMMRYGCGAHMTGGHHGGHHDRAGHDGPAEASTDPVCGMKVAPDAGYTKMDQGRAYRFCSKQCLEKFEAEPQRYLNAADSKEAS